MHTVLCYKLTSDQYNKNENCHGGYEWDGVCLSVCAVLSIKFPVPFYMSLCNLMFNGNNNKKNTVFQSNVY